MDVRMQIRNLGFEDFHIYPYYSHRQYTHGLEFGAAPEQDLGSVPELDSGRNTQSSQTGKDPSQRALSKAGITALAAFAFFFS
jgi:hypothetical protein